MIETQPDVLDGPPENLKIETLNKASVLSMLFQWDISAFEKGNGIIVDNK